MFLTGGGPHSEIRRSYATPNFLSLGREQLRIENFGVLYLRYFTPYCFGFLPARLCARGISDNYEPVVRSITLLSTSGTLCVLAVQVLHHSCRVRKIVDSF